MSNCISNKRRVQENNNSLTTDRLDKINFHAFLFNF